MFCNYERLSAQFVLKSVPFPQLVSLVLCLQIIITQSNEEMVLACSKRSDSGERCEVKKAMKSRGGLGREVRERL